MEIYQDIPEEIKESIIDYHAGNVTDKESETLLNWCNENQDHKKFLDDLTQIWHASVILDKSKHNGVDSALEDVLSKIIEDPEQDIVPVNSPKISIFLKIAASIAILIGFGSSLLYFDSLNKIKSKRSQYTEMSAPFGSRSFLTLADGTKVWLNSGSHLKIPGNFGEYTRDITLSGEAYFEVAKNKHKPFIVHTSELNITALGTIFNVKAYCDEPIIETTLEEGSVKIEPNHAGSRNTDPIYLLPKQKAIYERNLEKTVVSSNQNGQSKPEKVAEKQKKSEEIIKQPKILHVEDLRPVISWKDERWFIKQESLEELVRKLERRYDINVVFQDPEIKNFTFTGSLQDESIEQILHIIQLTAPIDYTVRHKKVTLRIDNTLCDKYKKLLMQQP